MRVIKNADERKNEILHISNQLFNEKGYENTSVSDILKEIGIAKGTLYYYFKSKEDIMNTIINQVTLNIFKNANSIAQDSNLTVPQKMINIILSLNIEDSDTGREIIKHVNNPKNTLMHQKQIDAIINGITPIFTKVINEGIEKEIFNTPFPKESTEMILIYALNTFDNNNITSMEELSQKISAFIYNLERIFNTKPGSFDFLAQLFN
ncbi:TetR/AcrR family transcriptional regulator [Terrisporobacter glycolicus]|uniref:HTH-type transcriptional regulator BetI n=1 Tax=Terrisporobacter glycolicus ATCC 14880 = DSM 1288 TaxID=1121315 RepID=A0ABZ2EUZ9_9FIRM|nr:TetR/AcrR family transcriptional regulator [Terrisporobacter glycolicus]